MKVKKMLLKISIWGKCYWRLFKLRKNQIEVLKKYYRKVQAKNIKDNTSEEINNLIEFITKQALLAIILFPFDTVCVQRSLVVFSILKDYGISSEISYGYRMKPFYMHAWLERNDVVIFDSPRESHLFRKSLIKYLN